MPSQVVRISKGVRLGANGYSCVHYQVLLWVFLINEEVYKVENQIVDVCTRVRLTQYHYCKAVNKSEDIVASTFPQKESHCKVLSGYQSAAVQLKSTHTYTLMCISILCIVYFNIIKLLTFIES